MNFDSRREVLVVKSRTSHRFRPWVLVGRVMLILAAIEGSWSAWATALRLQGLKPGTLIYPIWMVPPKAIQPGIFIEGLVLIGLVVLGAGVAGFMLLS